MIKIQDNVSVTIISLLLLMSAFYGFMFVLDGFANSFLERTGQEASETAINMMGNVGWLYLSMALGYLMVLIAPSEQSTVFMRFMVLGTFIMLVRMIDLYANAEGDVIYGPLIATALVFIGNAYVYNRLKMKVGMFL
ncbi:hypothetical protein N9E44_01830 [Pelagibacterales bacterium]|nr:hypothetical protein [Pelagibacterales bacterium]